MSRGGPVRNRYGDRPEPSPRLDPADVDRWYWTRTEMAGIARELGVSSSGNKAELADRLRAALAGKPLPPTTSRRRSRLEGDLTKDTVIPEGVVLTRNLRDWFEVELGTGFRADVHLRQFLAEGAGLTLGDAAEHWRATRGVPKVGIETQFELNRFTRDWWQANPNGTSEELREAWLEYRSTPAEHRIRPGESAS